MKPFFSVIIPLYNKEDFIEDTLKSVLNQTFDDFEVIIINDGSTDGSKEVVQQFKDERIKVIEQENRGLCASRNLGIKLAAAEYIAFLDADDLWMEDFLETINNLITLEGNTHKVFATNVTLLPPNAVPNLESTPFDKNDKLRIDNYFKISKNIFGPSCLVLNKRVFEKVGYFDESINYGEEDDFYIRCFVKYDIIYYKTPKMYYRTGVQDQLTAPNKNFERRIPNYDAYLKRFDHPDLKKYIDFVHYRLMVLYKMERNQKMADFYKKKICTKNLSFVQKIKFHMPVSAFYFSKLFYLRFAKIFSSN